MNLGHFNDIARPVIDQYPSISGHVHDSHFGTLRSPNDEQLNLDHPRKSMDSHIFANF